MLFSTLLFALAGCAQRAQIHTHPIGAEVWLNDAHMGVTPVEIRIPYRPFFLPPPELKVRLQPQYREVRVSLRDKSTGWHLVWHNARHPGIALGLRPAPVIEVQMVRRHGPIGTWGVPGD